MPKLSKLVTITTAIPGAVQSYLFDRRLGVSTRETLITADSLFAIGGDNLPYSGSQWLPVRRALADLAPGPDDVFVDLGSGRGKVVLIAGQMPFSRVIGVEIDQGLTLCAENNVRQARARLQAKEVASVTASALEWPIPDDVTIVFMYNPFMGQTFRQMVQRIIESYDRRPRSLYILYALPVEHDWLLSTGRVVVEKVRPSNWPSRFGWWRRGEVIVTYRLVAGSGATPTKLMMERPPQSSRAMQHWSSPNGYRVSVGPGGLQPSYTPFDAV